MSRAPGALTLIAFLLTAASAQAQSWAREPSTEGFLRFTKVGEVSAGVVGVALPASLQSATTEISITCWLLDNRELVGVESTVWVHDVRDVMLKTPEGRLQVDDNPLWRVFWNSWPFPNYDWWTLDLMNDDLPFPEPAIGGLREQIRQGETLVVSAITNDGPVEFRFSLEGFGAQERICEEEREHRLEEDIGGAEDWRLVVLEGTLAPGRTFNGSLASSDAVWDDGSHYDVWTVSAEAVGQRVVIDMVSDDMHTYPRVLRKDGTTVATDEVTGRGGEQYDEALELLDRAFAEACIPQAMTETLKSLETCLAHGADPNGTDENGRTTLDWAGEATIRRSWRRWSKRGRIRRWQRPHGADRRGYDVPRHGVPGRLPRMPGDGGGP